jgi:hypothetical protein
VTEDAILRAVSGIKPITMLMKPIDAANYSAALSNVTSWLKGFNAACDKDIELPSEWRTLLQLSFDINQAIRRSKE